MNKLEKPMNDIGFSSSKSYIMADLVAFHIVPLLFLMIKMDMISVGMMILLMTLNPLYVVIIGLVRGWRRGFGWKLPLLTGVIFAPSPLMYYMPLGTPEELMSAVMTAIIFTLVYWIFSFGATALGAGIRRALKW
jgi:hypothetical protein